MDFMENTKKKKLPLPVRLLLLPFKIIFILLIVILLWFSFCAFDRINPLDALPKDYTLYLRTDKIWNAAEPLLDLNATLVAMSSPELQQYRESYLKIKSSKLRKNPFVKFALQRRLDAALYGSANEADSPDFIALLDSGFLSGALRIAPYIIPHINGLKDKLELCNNSHGLYYSLSEKNFFVIKKNLLVFTSSKELIEEAMSFSNRNLYSSAELAALNAKTREPLRIFANGRYLGALAKDGLAQSYLSSITPYLSEKEYAELNFGISNNELNLTVSVPMELEKTEEPKTLAQTSQPEDSAAFQELQEPPVHPVLELLKRESMVPSLLPKFSEDVQYYTLISAGSLRELKNAAEKILPPEKDFSNTWNKSDSICRIVFNRSLEDILLSWTGDEFAIFGIEGKAEPVFTIKIADEAKRREIFDRIFSSYIVQSNDSLLIDGIRLPCIQLPGFMLSILKTFDVNVPKPYYLIKDDFIYFSQSPENLIAINQNINSAKKLSGSEGWKQVSSRQSPYSSLSLYYNLKRSIPFFIKGNSAMSKILSLYNSGRLDLRIKDKKLILQLQASAYELEGSRNIPGFPISLENKSNALLLQSNSKKSRLVFWLENDSTINSLDYSNFNRQKEKIPDLIYLTAADEATTKLNGGEIWAVTKSGLVYLLDSKLECLEGFPILTGINPSCQPFLYKDSIGLCSDQGSIIFVSSTGDTINLETLTEGGIKAPPAVNGDIFVFYEKGFFGGLHIYKNFQAINTEGPLELDGIAYGSPCILTNGSKQYIAMITQAGSLYVYDSEGKLLPQFPLELQGLFYLNVKAADGYLFALSAEGQLWRISLDAKVLEIKIPYLSAKTGMLSIFNYDDKGPEEIFVSGEGNSIYGFNSELELLPAFPVPGFGNPVFLDLNGDNKKDCLAITLDNKLSAQNVLK